MKKMKISKLTENVIESFSVSTVGCQAVAFGSGDWVGAAGRGGDEPTGACGFLVCARRYIGSESVEARGDSVIIGCCGGGIFLFGMRNTFLTEVRTMSARTLLFKSLPEAGLADAQKVLRDVMRFFNERRLRHNP